MTDEFTNEVADLAEPDIGELAKAATQEIKKNTALTELKAGEAFDYDIREIGARKTLALKDAVETEIIVAETMREAAEDIKKLRGELDELVEFWHTKKTSRARRPVENRMAAVRIRLSDAGLRLQRTVRSYTALSIANTSAMDELSLAAARMVMTDDMLEARVRQYVGVQKRKRRSLKEIKDGK